jgi:SAM-dependent methyltransferase
MASAARELLRKIFDPAMITTERVVEYPFVWQHLGNVSGPILDIGCVHSGLPIALASRGYPVVGLDFLPYPYTHPHLRAVRGDATLSPFGDHAFNVVLAVSVIEHIGLGHYGDPDGMTGDRETVQEIARVLQPGGRAILTVPYGQPLVDGSKRVYGASQLGHLLSPLSSVVIEYARSRHGLWEPCNESDAAGVNWTGSDRAVAMVVATNARTQDQGR